MQAVMKISVGINVWEIVERVFLQMTSELRTGEAKAPIHQLHLAVRGRSLGTGDEGESNES